jgi:YD repeat-containing protein
MLALLGVLLAATLACGTAGAVTSQQLADALVVDPDDVVLDHGLVVTSGAALVAGVETASADPGSEDPPIPPSVLLATGLAADAGTGNSDLLGDGLADATALSLTLLVPADRPTLMFTTQWVWGAPSGDLGQVLYRRDGSGAWSTLHVGGGPDWESTGSPGPVARTIDLRGANTVELVFEALDVGDGSGDSALVVSLLHFSNAGVVTASELADALLPDPATYEVNAASLRMISGAVTRTTDVTSALADPEGGGIVLSSGRGVEAGTGSTDFEGDSVPDCTELDLRIFPPEGAKSLVFTTQFVTTESGQPAGEEDFAEILTYSSAGGVPQVMGAGRAPAGTAGGVTRVVKLTGSTYHRIVFRACDGGDGLKDSALRISRAFFSDQDPSYFGSPKPSDSMLVTGTFSYAKELIHVPGVTEQLPFSFSLYYNSYPTDYKAWGETVWFLFIPIFSWPHVEYFREWSHSYDWSIEFPSSGPVVKRGDRAREYFEFDAWGEGGFLVDAIYRPQYGGVFSSLACHTDWGNLAESSCTYATKDQLTYVFKPVGSAWKLKRIQDANGNQVQLAYDAWGTMSAITDTRGNTATFTYDAAWNLTGIHYADELTASLEWEWDNYGRYPKWRLKAYTEPDGRRTAFGFYWDEWLVHEHNLITGGTIDDPTDGEPPTKLFSNEYQYETWRVVKQWDGGNRLSTNSYSYNWASHRDRRGNTSTTVHDANHRPLWTVDEEGARVDFAWDADDNLIWRMDEMGGQTWAEYDDSGNLIGRRDPDGSTITRAYDSRNRLLTHTVGDTFTTSFAYDDRGNVVTQTDPMGQSVTLTYSPRGQRETVTDRNGNTVRYAYTEAGDVRSVTDAMGGVTSFVYDALGRAVSQTDPNGNRTLTGYDPAGRVVSRTDALGHTVTYAHNVLGRPRRITLPNGAQTNYEYSPTGKLVRAVSPMGSAIRYTYDGEDNLLSQTDPLGRVTQHQYDRANRMSRVVLKDSVGNIVNEARHTYDLAGRRTGNIDPMGNATALEYDAAGRVLAEADPLGNRVMNEYGDPRGLLTGLINGRGQRLQMGYDAAGRLTNLFFPDETVIGHNLDPNGNRLVTIGRNLESTHRTFDGLNRMTSRTDEFGKTIGYEHDPAGNLVGLTYSDGKRVAYEYDALNRMVKVTDWEGRATSYSYDEVGRPASTTLPDGSVVTYSYDLSNRLIGITDVAPDGSTIYSTRYTLDAAGLRVSEETHLPLEPLATSLIQNRTHDGGNQLVSDGRDAFEYDGDGNMTRGTVGGVPKEMSYNEMSQLYMPS